MRLNFLVNTFNQALIKHGDSFWLFGRNLRAIIILIDKFKGWDIMMSFTRNAKTPHFDIDELKQIYEAIKTKDTPSMKRMAEKLFPGRNPICYENMEIWNGPGKAFKHNGEEYVKPKYIINAHPLIVGIMADGTFYQF